MQLVPVEMADRMVALARREAGWRSAAIILAGVLLVILAAGALLMWPTGARAQSIPVEAICLNSNCGVAGKYADSSFACQNCPAGTYNAQTCAGTTCTKCATALTFTPQRLAYRFSGSSGALTDLRSVLFQKTNGVFWLALWQGISVFDYTNGTDSTPFPASQSVTLALNQPATVTFFQDTEVDTVGGGTSLGLQTSCTLSVGPRVSLVRIAV
jgi:hypothetical protein